MLLCGPHEHLCYSSDLQAPLTFIIYDPLLLSLPTPETILNYKMYIPFSPHPFLLSFIIVMYYILPFVYSFTFSREINEARSAELTVLIHEKTRTSSRIVLVEIN